MSDATRLPYLESLVADAGFQSEAAQLQAKALLVELGADPGTRRWTYLASRIVRNLVAASHELESALAARTEQLPRAYDPARRLGMLWESLADLAESTSRRLALTNAALAYEIAGYQANTLCLARQLERESRAHHSSFEALTSVFLQRHFLRLKPVCESLQAEPGELDLSEESIAERIGTALAAKALEQSLRFFLQGEFGILHNVLEGLRDAEHVFVSAGFAAEAMVARSLRSLLPLQVSRSTWAALVTSPRVHPKWLRYLKLLARGTGEFVYTSRSVSELWPSQVATLEGGLLELDRSKIVRMPTSSGKTRVAEMAIVNALISRPGCRCVYVAPYRALAAEVENTLATVLADLGFRVAAITGSFEYDALEEQLFRETDLLVTTPEKLDLLLRAKPDYLSQVVLIVLDEGHIVQEGRRGVKVELLLTRLKRRLTNASFLVLSAVVPQATLDEFSSWFATKTPAAVLSSDWRPSIQRLALFDWKRDIGQLRFAHSSESGLPEQVVSGVVETREFLYLGRGGTRVINKVFPATDSKAQTAAELAFKFAELGPVLVFCTQKDLAEAVARALFDRLDYTRKDSQNLYSIPDYFFPAEPPPSSLLAREWLGDRPITTWLGAGIAVHHGSIPHVVRAAIETDFRLRRYRVIVATNTLAQGVNLPIRTVVIHSTRRRSATGLERIPARDYWNIAGRAGRAGEETDGLTVHIKTNRQDEEDFAFFVSRKSNVEKVQSALHSLVAELIAGRLSEESLKAELDSEVLAIIAEEGLATDTAIVELLNSSLFGIQAQAEQRATLDRVFRSCADEIRSRTIPADYQVFSATGLSSVSCEQVLADVRARASLLRELATSLEPDTTPRCLDAIVPILLTLREMAQPTAYSGSIMEVLHRWIGGSSAEALFGDAADGHVGDDAIASLIDELFGYRLPWGASAYRSILVHGLGLADFELSPFFSYLPSMIRYGVSSPMACWAITLGVSSRRAATVLGLRFLQSSQQFDFAAFARWLSHMSRTSEPAELGLTFGEQLRVSRAAAALSTSTYLRNYEGLASFLPREATIDASDTTAFEQALLLSPDSRDVQLRRDYGSVIDRNAIDVVLAGRIVGQLPSDLADVLAPELDSGASLKVHLLGTSLEPPVATIRILSAE